MLSPDDKHTITDALVYGVCGIIAGFIFFWLPLIAERHKQTNGPVDPVDPFHEAAPMVAGVR